MRSSLLTLLSESQPSVPDLFSKLPSQLQQTLLRVVHLTRLEHLCLDETDYVLEVPGLFHELQRDSRIACKEKLDETHPTQCVCS